MTRFSLEPKSQHLHVINVYDPAEPKALHVARPLSWSYKAKIQLEPHSVKQLTPIKPYLFIWQCMRPRHYCHSSEADWLSSERKRHPTPPLPLKFAVHPQSPLRDHSVGGGGGCWTIQHNTCATNCLKASVCMCTWVAHHPVESDHVFPIAVVERHMTFHHFTQWVDVLPRSPNILFLSHAVM